MGGVTMQKKNAAPPLFSLKPIAFSVGCALFTVHGYAWAEESSTETAARQETRTADDGMQEVEFNPSFLSAFPGSQQTLSQYSRGNPLVVGRYPSIISVNDRKLGKREIRIEKVNGKPAVCITSQILTDSGINQEKLSSAELKHLQDPAACVPFSALTQEGRAYYDMSSLTLNFAMPQAMLYTQGRGYLSPELWDGGQTALLFNYNTNYYNAVSHGKSWQSAYAGLNVGLNFESWMFRHTGNLNWRDDSGSNYKSNRTYVQRDINALRSRLTIGRNFTSGELFDSFGYRGAELASVDQMLPDSLRDYAPIVQGTADTNAKVSVRQNGVTLYETVVPPGPFAINDLYPTGYGGDIDVTVQESDGRVKTFSVPFSSVAQLLRAGMTRYSLLAGEVDIQNNSWHPKIAHGTIQHGFNNVFTGYAGGLTTDDYSALLLGGAVNTGVGALALDITGAKTQLNNFSHTGSSTRLTYSKRIAETRSSISLAAYRYSSSGYLDLNNAMSLAEWQHNGGSSTNNSYSWRQRSRFSVTLNQYLQDGYGQFYLTGYNQNYWGRSGNDTQYQLGYSNNWRSLTYSLAVSRQRNATGDNQNQFTLTLTMPLGQVSAHTPYLSMSTGWDSDNKLTNQTSVSGQLGEYNQANYSVGYSHTKDDDAGNLSAGYRTPWTMVTGSYAQGKNYHSSSAGLTGALLLHKGGLVASPYTANTMALVHAPDAAGAQILSYPDIHLDSQGYALVPNLRPYRLNDITLDPKGLSTDVELLSTKEQAVPRDGAVVAVNFMTDVGRSVLIKAQDKHNNPLPFGASVIDQDNNLVGYVGQGGMALVRLKQDNSRLKVMLNNNALCAMSVNLPAAEKNQSRRFENISATCE